MTVYRSQNGQIIYETKSLNEYDCDYLLPELLLLIQENSTDYEGPHIFGASDLFEHTHSWDELVCKGIIETSRYESPFTFFVDLSAEGVLYYSWRIEEN